MAVPFATIKEYGPHGATVTGRPKPFNTQF